MAPKLAPLAHEPRVSRRPYDAIYELPYRKQTDDQVDTSLRQLTASGARQLRPVTMASHTRFRKGMPLRSIVSEPRLPNKRPLVGATAPTIQTVTSSLTLAAAPKFPAKPRWGMTGGGALAAEMRRRKALRLRNTYDALRAKTADASKGHDWQAMEAHVSKQIAMCEGNVALFSARSRANRKLGKFAQGLRDADVMVNLAPYSAKGHYRRAQVLCEDAKLTAAGESLIKSLSLSGMDGPSTDGAGFGDLGQLRLGATPHPDAEEEEGRPNPECSKFGDVLGGIRRSRSFFQQSNKGKPGANLVRELGGHGLNMRTVDGGQAEAARPPGQCASPTTTSVTAHAINVLWRDVLDDGGDDIFQYDLEWAEVCACARGLEPPWPSPGAKRPPGRMPSWPPQPRLPYILLS